MHECSGDEHTDVFKNRDLGSIKALQKCGDIQFSIVISSAAGSSANVDDPAESRNLLFRSNWPNSRFLDLRNVGDSWSVTIFRKARWVRMPMSDLKQFEFCLLRYVPNVIREEFVNIGLLLFEPQSSGFGFADVRMTSDWWRATCLDRQVDVEVLQALEADIRMRLQHPQDVGSLLHKLEDSFANLIQISPRKICLAAEPVRELETLCSLYLEESPLEELPAADRRKSERAMILAQMKDALVRAGIWALIGTQIPAAKYTEKKGDPLIFDFGYEVGGQVRFFQAVPLKTNFNQLMAVNIAHRFPKVADCIHAENRTSARLTAVVADHLDRTNPDIEFALGAFKDNNVHVAAAADMPSIAERARQELNAWRR